jgi:hypothetical protein
MDELSAQSRSLCFLSPVSAIFRAIQIARPNPYALDQLANPRRFAVNSPSGAAVLLNYLEKYRLYHGLSFGPVDLSR